MGQRNLTAGCHGRDGNYYVDDGQNYDGGGGLLIPISAPFTPTPCEGKEGDDASSWLPAARGRYHIDIYLCVEYSEGRDYVTRSVSFAQHPPAAHSKWQPARSVVTVTRCCIGEVGSAARSEGFHSRNNRTTYANRNIRPSHMFFRVFFLLTETALKCMLALLAASVCVFGFVCLLVGGWLWE